MGDAPGLPHILSVAGDAPKYLNDFYLLEGLGGTAPKWRKVGPVPGEARPGPNGAACWNGSEVIWDRWGRVVGLSHMVNCPALAVPGAA